MIGWRLASSVAHRSLLPRNSPDSVYRNLIKGSYRRNLSTASRVCSSFPPNRNDWWSSSTFGARLIHGTAYTAKDYFDTLGVSRYATQSDIKKAYFQRAKELHPDTNKYDPQAQQKFQQLSKAYEVLKDEGKRAQYASSIMNNKQQQSHYKQQQSHYKQQQSRSSKPNPPKHGMKPPGKEQSITNQLGFPFSSSSSLHFNLQLQLSGPSPASEKQKRRSLSDEFGSFGLDITKTGSLCCVAARPHGSSSTDDPNEPYWQTNSSFSPPPPNSGWGFGFSPEELLPCDSSDHNLVHRSSVKETGWMIGNPFYSHRNITSDGGEGFLSSFDEFEAATSRGNSAFVRV
ncbi:Chaperone protein dnaJ GFA2, mitochondrial [Linum grandiflorum]